MMGSTSNALDKGGNNFKKLYYNSDATKRNRNGQTSSGLYSLFIPMEWNYEGFMDTFGLPVFTTPEDKTIGVDGIKIETGVIEHWENEVDGLKSDQDSLNEYYRQFPWTEQHAFRDEAKQSLFNLVKIYEQIDYNEEVNNLANVTRGSFQWRNGVKDTEVIFYPNNNGRFLISWVPPKNLQNRVIIKNGVKCLIVLRDPRDVMSSIYYGKGKEFIGFSRPLLFNIYNWRKSVDFALKLADESNFLFV